MKEANAILNSTAAPPSRSARRSTLCSAIASKLHRAPIHIRLQIVPLIGDETGDVSPACLSMQTYMHTYRQHKTVTDISVQQDPCQDQRVNSLTQHKTNKKQNIIDTLFFMTLMTNIKSVPTCNVPIEEN